MSGLPKLPRDVSPNGEEIWDWAGRLSRWSHLNHEIRTLTAAIAQRPRECGSCRFWMCGRLCPREYNEKGRPRGPSMKAPICGKYEMKPQDVKMQEERKERLAALIAERDAA